MQKGAKIKANFFSDIKKELFLVKWPTKQETIKLTLVIIVISGIVAVYVGIADYILTQMMGKLIR